MEEITLTLTRVELRMLISEMAENIEKAKLDGEPYPPKFQALVNKLNKLF